MKALVAASWHLLLVDLATRRVEVVEDHRTGYYGISWFPGRSGLVLSHSGLDTGDLVDVTAYAGSEKGWLSHGERRTRAFLSAPHQLVCAPDGRVVCTNTGRNRIQVIDFDKPGWVQEARLSEANWDRLGPHDAAGDHLNSVFFRGDVLYLLAHGFDRHSSLATFTYPALHLIDVRPVRGRSGMHNIFATEAGQLLACDSNAGALVDLSDQSVLWESGAPGYLRGLAATDDIVVVGDSAIGARDRRHHSVSGVWLVDRATWRALDYVYLGPFGGVHEVRIVDEPDLAHHGAPLHDVDLSLGAPKAATCAKARLAAAGRAAAAAQHWRGYRMAFGATTSSDDGWRSSSGLSLALAVAGIEDQPVAFRYMLEGDLPNAHVAAVIGYRGDGRDTHMTALLVQAGARGATLELWKNEGGAWAKEPWFSVHALPLAGELTVRLENGALCVLVDGEPIASLPAGDIGRWQGKAGIRWNECAVRPTIA